MIASWKHEASADDEPCEGCDGTGLRAPATPSCFLPVRYRSWVVVERCDYCERFPDDLTAARTLFTDAKWIECASGGWHAVGRRPWAAAKRNVAITEPLHSQLVEKPELAPIRLMRQL